MKRLTVLLPDKLHKRLSKEAAEQGIGLSALVRMRLAEETDSLLQAAGIGSDGTLNIDLDKDLYDL